ncbi:hypothetical protein Cyast_2850 [Cyanobacterium stanieri PCC 7202]|uniref:Uncharacterized protein n=1 Tax=Cyanobacterium stanieri (strain ATCC 29140 / PCC 7202) TaxID=292563 RepID=K9YQZ8_CYASC|nr:hypothetical protein Cyast_2850 [Cyanobacterium stanieri PCC 7202]
MSHLEENQSNSWRSGNFLVIIICGAIALMGFGYVLIQLPEITPEQIEIYQTGTCIEGGWRYGLIVTHVLTFILIPVAMRIFYEALNNLKLPTKTIFASQLGLALIMVSIASEIGWHVTQCWYYQNDFTMLNFMFYFFLISAFALWADGLNKETNSSTHIINIIFSLSLLTVSILYPIGYKLDNPNLKIPIYIALTLVFAVLTYRGYKLLEDWKIVLVPTFSVGVNLTFVFLLDQFGGDPFHPEIFYNALFHILHDLTGTQAGIAIFTWLVYQKGIAEYQKNN